MNKTFTKKMKYLPKLLILPPEIPLERKWHHFFPKSTVLHQVWYLKDSIIIYPFGCNKYFIGFDKYFLKINPYFHQYFVTTA